MLHHAELCWLNLHFSYTCTATVYMYCICTHNRQYIIYNIFSFKYKCTLRPKRRKEFRVNTTSREKFRNTDRIVFEDPSVPSSFYNYPILLVLLVSLCSGPVYYSGCFWFNKTIYYNTADCTITTL